MGVRSGLSIGPGPSYDSYDTAPVRWVMRKEFTAPEDGVAVVSSTTFRGDGGARVRINSVDAGMYGQWNMPATSGTAQIPVTAGPNVVEIEVRDGAGNNWIQGRLDIVMTRTMQFMRRTVVDCETGATVSVVDTTLDGDPYTVTGEVGQCETLSECCEQPRRSSVSTSRPNCCVSATRPAVTSSARPWSSGSMTTSPVTAWSSASPTRPRATRWSCRPGPSWHAARPRTASPGKSAWSRPGYPSS